MKRVNKMWERKLEFNIQKSSTATKDPKEEIGLYLVDMIDKYHTTQEGTTSL